MRLWVLILVAALASACASMPSPTTCALIGAGLGGAGGAVAGAKSDSGDDFDEAAGFGVAGVLVGGAAGYLICKLLEEEPPPPEPAPAPPAPEPAPPPPPPAADPCAQVIRLRGVNFDFDKSEIRPDAAVALDEAVSLVQDLLQQCPAKRIDIEGHTDSTGPETYNQGLSERRAASVRRYLVDKGLDGSRLSATGLGETRPVGPNDTREGRALNRRVDLRMVD